MDLLYVGNDNIVEIQGLRDADGKLITGAAAVVTLYEDDGVTEVSGAAWPLAMAYTGTRGVYRAELPATLALVSKKRYRMKLEATYVGKVFSVTRDVRAEERFG